MRALRKRHGRASAGMRTALQEARGAGATHYDPAGVLGKPTVYRPTERGWQAALVKPQSGGGHYLTRWDWAPFRIGPQAAHAETIDAAIRSV